MEEVVTLICNLYLFYQYIHIAYTGNKLP